MCSRNIIFYGFDECQELDYRTYYESDGVIKKKSDVVFDGILYEINKDGKVTPIIDFRNAAVCDDGDCYVRLMDDYELYYDETDIGWRVGIAASNSVI